MTVTLCLETSSAHCSVALRARKAVDTPDAIVDDTRLLRRKHNEELLGMIDGLYARAGLEPRETDLVAFSCGPGSFTGVRIGAAVTQAIAVAAGAAVVPVASSKVWVASARDTSDAREWLCGVRSRGEAYYLSRYRVAGEDIEEVAADVLYEAWPSEMELPATFAFVGDAPPWLPSVARDAHVVCVPSASAFLNLVRAAHARGASLDPELALPSYVRGDSPWRAAGAG